MSPKCSVGWYMPFSLTVNRWLEGTNALADSAVTNVTTTLLNSKNWTRTISLRKTAHPKTTTSQGSISPPSALQASILQHLALHSHSFLGIHLPGFTKTPPPSTLTLLPLNHHSLSLKVDKQDFSVTLSGWCCSVLLFSILKGFLR